jgi:hypothetical protein
LYENYHLKETQKIISNIFFSLAEGHDSMEDAISCMELILWKVKQDLKSTSSNR